MEKIEAGNGAGRIHPRIIPLGVERLPQGNHRASGMVLRRRDISGKNQELLLFLNGFGAMWVSAPGSGRSNRFGGGTEPMTWGVFDLYQSPRRIYLKGVDIREFFWGVRKSKRSLDTAVKWCIELSSRLPTGHESDSLLSLLWGSMKNLSAGVNHLLIDARFAWRWGNLWGLAPSLDLCQCCGRAIDITSSNMTAMSRDGFVCGACLSEMKKRSESSTLRGQISAEAVRVLRLAATIPREGFIVWAKSDEADAAALANLKQELRDCASWFYSLL
ncbi:MAG: DNA repair protein RecO C-terminal domain-containing protein [Synergistaceae bacterium]|jgi:DNA repair protein RecO (recombination protein O)|nr:DNA repair protein RecO C-terminal domain-containing protein [Synergistaceae bacterium]